MKNTYKLILFLLLITHASFGQDVKGYIKDAESKEALAGVNVFYKDKGGTRGTVSDINGYYELKVTDGVSQTNSPFKEVLPVFSSSTEVFTKASF